MTESTDPIADAISQVLEESAEAAPVDVVEMDETLVEDDSPVDTDVDVEDEPVEAAEESEESEGEEPEDAEDDEAVEEESSDAEESDPVVLDGDDVVVIDGREVRVADALEMRADYTRKTQALAEERKAFEEAQQQFAEQGEYLSGLEAAWAANPSDVIAGFAGATEDVIESVGDAIVSLAGADQVDPNLFVVRTIVHLIQNELLDEELRGLLGFDDETVKRVKSESKTEDRIRKIEKQMKQAPAPEPAPAVDEAAAVEAARSRIEGQWNSIVEGDARLAGLDGAAQLKVRSEVARIALDRDVPLDVAYELLEASRVKAEAEMQAKRAATARKKSAASKAVSKSSSSAAASAPRDPSDVQAAIEEALRDLGG